MLLEVDGAPLNERVLGNHKLGETIFTRYREHLAKTEEKNTRNNNLSEHSLACSKKIDNALISLPSAVPTSAFVAPFVKWSNYTSSVSAKQNRKGFQTSLNAENTTLLKVTKSEIFRLPKKLHGQPTTNEKNNRRKQLNSSAKNGLRKNGQNFYVNNQSRDFNIKSSTKSKYGGKHSHSSCGFYKKQSYFLPSAPYASKQYSRDIKKREDLVHTSPDKTDFFVCPRKSRLKSLLKEDANVTLPPSIINSISPLDVLKTEPTVANIKRKAFTSHSSREGDRLSLIHFYGTDYENKAQQKMEEEQKEMALLRRELKRVEKMGKEKQKRDQRKRIRALNRLMTQLEQEKFERFMTDLASTKDDLL